MEPLYTTQLGAGLGMINETKTLLDLWRPGMKSTALFQQALDSGCFPKMSARRIRNLVSECFIPRYLITKDFPASVLKTLKDMLTSNEFSQLLFLFTVRANAILYDFIQTVYWNKYISGHETITNENAKEFVIHANQTGKTTTPWSESMISRVSAYLTGCCADFGLLEYGQRSSRKIKTFRVESISVAFISYDLHFSGLGDNAIILHQDWGLFGLQKEDVLEELKKASMKGFFIIQAAGDVTRIGWNFNNWEEFVHAIAK